jgi:hypothetical protein
MSFGDDDLNWGLGEMGLGSSYASLLRAPGTNAPASQDG